MNSEEISGSKRRHHEPSFKADLILQSLVPGASVSAIALAAGLNANSLFKWRRDHLRAVRPPSASAVTLVPVHLSPARQIVAVQADAEGANSTAVSRGHDDVIEVEFAGAWLRVRSPVDEVALVTVLRALRRSA